MKKSFPVTSWIALGTILLSGDLSLAQNPPEPIAYPARGQNPQQQQQDEFACYSWAKAETGVDPSQPEPQPTAQASPRGGPLMRREEEKKAAQAQAQAQAQEQQKMQSYYRAWTACMTGRGYSVQ